MHLWWCDGERRHRARLSMGEVLWFILFRFSGGVLWSNDAVSHTQSTTTHVPQ